MPGIRDHRELLVYKLCDEVRLRVRKLLARPAFDRSPKLRSQLEESSERPCANIGEGFSRFRPKEFAQFLRIAKASETETIEHLTRAASKGCITEDEADDVSSIARRARAALTQFVRYLETAEAPDTTRARPLEPEEQTIDR
jgi:four helix bundle protein